MNKYVLRFALNRIEVANTTLDSPFQITRVKGTDRVPLLLVGNKVDLEHQREVATMEGLALAQAWNCPFIEASARNKMNVNEVFAEIVREMNCNPAKEKRPYCCCNLL